ncbi:MAG: Lrp/AsnC family transcriptional regulator [Candidatus Bathyarchaeota archaeon]
MKNIERGKRLDKNNSESVDDIDIQILSALGEDARKSYREIATKLKVAPGTIYNRIKKMNDSGIIRGYIPLLDYDKLGYGFIALIFLQIEGKHLIEVEEQLAKPQEVVGVYDITGEFDVAIISRFQNITSMNKFIKETLQNPYIKRTVTNVVLNIVKEDPRIKI